MSVQRHFSNKTASASVDNVDVTIPVNKTVVITAIDFTAPAQASAGVKVLVGPVGSPTMVIAAAQGDKFMSIPSTDGAIEGPKDIRLQLDNSSNPNAAFLGVAVYYEEL